MRSRTRPILWFITTVIVCCNSLGSEQINMTEVQTNLRHRLKGHFQYVADEDLYAWKFTITFSRAVSSITVTTGDIASHNDTTVTIVNNPYVPTLQNATLNIGIEASYTGKTKPSAIGVLVNLMDDGMVVPSLVNNDNTKYNYNEVLMKSILFYEAQRSGKLPASNRITWRSDSALQDKGDKGEDLTGGWYDAGDNEKFGFPMAGATTMLSWGLLRFKDAYESSRQLDHMYDSIRWPLEWLIKSHTAPNELYYVNVGVRADHQTWDRPENITKVRHFLKINKTHPGSEIAGEYAAAMAAGYLVFKEKDPGFSDELLKHAIQLNNFSVAFQGKTSDSNPAAKGIYETGSYTDEIAWAGAWLYKATGEEKYLNQAKQYSCHGISYQSWDNKCFGTQILLFESTKNNTYKQLMQNTLASLLPNGTKPTTPNGLVFLDKWGSLRHSANNAFLALVAADDGLHSVEYRCFAKRQIHYMLGDSGRSFVVGFGKNPPSHEHHRGASCPLPPAHCGWAFFNTKNSNPHVLYGALVGGPDVHGSYTDSRQDYVHNEVAVDYNAGFQSAVAGLKSLVIRGQYPPC